MEKVWLFIILVFIVGTTLAIVGILTDDPIVGFSGVIVNNFACCPAAIIGGLATLALKRAGVI